MTTCFFKIIEPIGLKLVALVFQLILNTIAEIRAISLILMNLSNSLIWLICNYVEEAGEQLG